MNAPAFLRLSIGAFALALSCSAIAENAFTARYTTVRAGPDRSYPVIAQLDADTPVQVMGCLDDWSWCDVGFGGDRGWLYAPELTYEYEGGYVPLYSYAPGLGIPVVVFAVDTYWPRYYQDRPFYRERDEWERRGPPHHERPPGPPPSYGPPPREALVSRPGADSQRGRSIRLGSAEPNSRGAAERDDRGRNQPGDHGTVRAPEPRSQEYPPAAASRAEPSRAETSRTEPSRAETPRTEPRPRPAERSAPARNEQQAHPTPQRAAPQREEHPAEPPRREERSDHPPG